MPFLDKTGLDVEVRDKHTVAKLFADHFVGIIMH